MAKAEELTDAEKAHRAKALIGDISSDRATHLQERAWDIIDDLAVEMDQDE